LNRASLVKIAVALVVLAGVAAAVGATAFSGGHHPRPRKVVRAISEIDYVGSSKELIEKSSVIVYGVATGRSSFTVRSDDGIYGDYLQDVRVLDVLKGQAPSTVRVVRLGLSSSAQANGVQADELGGRLPAGPTVYFLQPSASPGVLQIVGHTQGSLVFGSNGRVTKVETHGFDSFVGLTLAQVKARVSAGA
jgi:hypothetical protein